MAQNERKQENRILSNREIRSKEVRLISADGTNLGITPFFKALSMAQEQDLDLILISNGNYPPVCKIGDVGKYKYDMQKRQKEADRKSRENRVEIKEVQFRPGIDKHDLDVKIKHIEEWLNDGDRVKIVIKFRGRELVNSGGSTSIIDEIIKHFPNAKLEGNRELQGNRLIATLFQGKQR
jgi:translation initiation factor IF-3